MTSFRYFGSRMCKPFNLLSNFSECEIKGEMFVMNSNGCIGQKEYVFPSSEHFWWAHFLLLDKDISRLAVGGDLSTLESGLQILLHSNISQRKIKYWKKSCSVGVVAKILAFRDKTSNVRIIAKKLGMTMSIHPMECYGLKSRTYTIVSIWKKILIAKYSQNIRHRMALLSTGEEHLVEFCKTNPEKQFWAGKVKDGSKTNTGIIKGGTLVGNNFMGKCLMATRKEMKKL